MFIRDLPAKKDTMFYCPVCKLRLLNLCRFLQYSLRWRRLILRRSVESRTPLEKLYNLKKKCFLTVYMHIFQI